ncbi:MAG: hypothetical protein Q4P34_07140 [Tissierellia bacterium]|nr:hypothetical protein [Tissierellia bacterium]
MKKKISSIIIFIMIITSHSYAVNSTQKEKEIKEFAILFLKDAFNPREGFNYKDISEKYLKEDNFLFNKEMYIRALFSESELKSDELSDIEVTNYNFRIKNISVHRIDGKYYKVIVDEVDRSYRFNIKSNEEINRSVIHTVELLVMDEDGKYYIMDIFSDDTMSNIFFKDFESRDDGIIAYTLGMKREDINYFDLFTIQMSRLNEVSKYKKYDINNRDLDKIKDFEDDELKELAIAFLKDIYSPHIDLSYEELEGQYLYKDNFLFNREVSLQNKAVKAKLKSYSKEELDIENPEFEFGEFTIQRNDDYYRVDIDKFNIIYKCKKGGKNSKDKSIRYKASVKLKNIDNILYIVDLIADDEISCKLHKRYEDESRNRIPYIDNSESYNVQYAILPYYQIQNIKEIEKEVLGEETRELGYKEIDELEILSLKWNYRYRNIINYFLTEYFILEMR